MNKFQEIIELDEAGFTLIEALIAMVVLTIGVFALYTMQVVGIRGNSLANSISTATNISSAQVEDLISRAFADKKRLVDTNGDGTNQDPDKNGIDEQGGGNFGLENVDSDADYSHTTADGLYTVFYNVAVGVPLPNTKTIQVLVRDNARRMNNTVNIQYIKNGNI
ncbi:MAG: prepilin-type N-terminal cleavage/methylation domain-containing protein [Desulfobulbus sp.]|jgi:prepilin-type N-terminal cleavage/methylation domain-containing protein|nr:prepilin-type N-terminal cleavage/methylation domain-containing protein [Desulfobulbus sp.]